MLKTFITASLLTAAVFGASVLPAQAAPNQSDCAYASQLLDIGAGPQGGSSYHPYAIAVQQCR